jgi:hypothetical protein
MGVGQLLTIKKRFLSVTQGLGIGWLLWNGLGNGQEYVLHLMKGEWINTKRRSYDPISICMNEEICISKVSCFQWSTMIMIYD